MAAGVPCSPFRSATPHSTASRARRFPLQMIFNCSIFDGNHCSNLDGSGQTEYITKEIKTVTKPKRWGIGLQAGYGVSFSNKQIKATPYIGIGISYNILTW